MQRQSLRFQPLIFLTLLFSFLPLFALELPCCPLRHAVLSSMVRFESTSMERFESASKERLELEWPSSERLELVVRRRREAEELLAENRSRRNSEAAGEQV